MLSLPLVFVIIFRIPISWGYLVTWSLLLIYDPFETWRKFKSEFAQSNLANQRFEVNEIVIDIFSVFIFYAFVEPKVDLEINCVEYLVKNSLSNSPLALIWMLWSLKFWMRRLICLTRRLSLMKKILFAALYHSVWLTMSWKSIGVVKVCAIDAY